MAYQLTHAQLRVWMVVLLSWFVVRCNVLNGCVRHYSDSVALFEL